VEASPTLSEETLNYQHGKHHQAMLTNLNGLIEGTDLPDKSLDPRDSSRSRRRKAKAGLFQQCRAGVESHILLALHEPGGGGKPTGKIAAMIDSDLGGYDQFS